MIPIGATLAAAREARGLDLRDAERLTCMRARYLTALEADHFDDLPGHTYARAFLRTYSSALGLDADLIVAEFDEQVPEPLETVELSAPPRRNAGLGALRAAPLLGLAAVFVVLVWAAWTNNGHRRTPVAASQAVPVAAPTPRPLPKPVVPAAHVTHRASTALVLHAARGRCWVEARRGGPNGALLAERTLEIGDTLRLPGAHLWLRLGAPWNVDVHRGTHVVPLAPSTQPVNVTV